MCCQDNRQQRTTNPKGEGRTFVGPCLLALWVLEWTWFREDASRRDTLIPFNHRCIVSELAYIY